MRKALPIIILSLCFTHVLFSQELVLKKGKVISGLRVNDSISESFSIYLPTAFDQNKKWPVVYVFDMNGNAKQSLRAMVSAAEQEGYILAGSESLVSTFSTTVKIEITFRMINAVSKMLPIQSNRSYTADFTDNAGFALVVSRFSKQIKGVISTDNAIPRYEALSKAFKIYFVGLVEKESENYQFMVNKSKFLNEIKFSNRLIIRENRYELLTKDTFVDALETFTLSAMVKGDLPRNDTLIMRAHDKHLGKVDELIMDSRLLNAHHLLSEMIKMYGSHINADALRSKRDSLEKEDIYVAQNKIRNGMFLKEKIRREEYEYSLFDDVWDLNYENLGWWQYQMEKINGYEESHSIHEIRMGKRLSAYFEHTPFLRTVLQHS